MTNDEMKKLRRGDLVAHKSGSKLYVVTGNYGDHVTAVDSVDITNAIEWNKVTPPPRATSGDA